MSSPTDPLLHGGGGAGAGPERSVRGEPRWPALEGVRGIAVASVVGFHTLRLVLARHGGNWGDVSSSWWWAGTGRLGVDVFFVLAGFLVVGSWRSCRSRSESSASAVRTFASRRAWRILPPYLVMLAVLVPLTMPRLLGSVDGVQDLLRFVTLQQYLDPYLPAQLNVPIWSLTTEVHFYLLVPLASWLLLRYGGWRLVVPAMALGLWWSHSPFRGEMAAGLLPGRLDQFLVGAAAGALVLRWEAGDHVRIVAALRRRGVLPALTVALLAVGTWHGATYQSGSTSWIPLLVHPLAGLITAGLLIRLLCGEPVSLCTSPVLTWLGGISYSLYLWHYPILDRGLRAAGPEMRTSGRVALTTLLLLGVTLAVAVVSQAFVERPAAEYRRRRAAGAAAALPVLEPELGLEALEEVPGTERHQASGTIGGRADDRVALP